jgi:hypothetical protein
LVRQAGSPRAAPPGPRARIVSEPVSEYIRWEYDITLTNVESGEAVAIVRELDEASPGRHRPALAQSLDNFAEVLEALDRPAEALPVSGEVVAIVRDLDEASPGPMALS